MLNKVPELHDKGLGFLVAAALSTERPVLQATHIPGPHLR